MYSSSSSSIVIARSREIFFLSLCQWAMTSILALPPSSAGRKKERRATNQSHGASKSPENIVRPSCVQVSGNQSLCVCVVCYSVSIGDKNSGGWRKALSRRRRRQRDHEQRNCMQKTPLDGEHKEESGWRVNYCILHVYRITSRLVATRMQRLH